MQHSQTSLLTVQSSKATLPAIKLHNSQLLLRLLRRQGALSRAELARQTHLSRPAISAIVRDLIEDGLIEEIGIGTSQGGKRPTLISLKADARQIIAVDLGGKAMLGLRTDLAASTLAEQAAPFAANGTEPLENLYSLLDRLVAEAESPLLGIGIGTPGLVDPATGTVTFAANLGWRDLPLARLLAERYALPVYIDNDTHLAALGEYHFGAGVGSTPLAVAKVGPGIGVGMLIAGEIYSGANGWSGEIGHLAVVENGDICTCGRRGCLETVASTRGITREAARLAAEHPASLLARLSAGERADPAVLQQALAQGDSVSLMLVNRAGYYLGVGFAALVHVFNPQRIVIAGSIAQFGEPLFAAIRKGLDNSALEALAVATEIVPAALDERAGLLGAVALVLNRELGIF